MTEKQAIVFFSRDFLSGWFPKLGRALSSYHRVYIVTDAVESQVVRAIDPGGEIFNLMSVENRESPEAEIDLREFLGANHDRFLRSMSSQAIEDVYRSCSGTVKNILEKYSVASYVDEPVANFPNFLFNRRFREIGATCFHYNSSWLPGYGFLCSDASQGEPVPLNRVVNGTELVYAHASLREAGGGVPSYVLPYHGATLRYLSASKFLIKAAVKFVARRNAFYLRQSYKSDLFHAKCLLSSLQYSYSSPKKLAVSDIRYVIYPLHYEPENILTYFSCHTRQNEVVAQILDTLPPGFELVLKEHPSQPGALSTGAWREMARHERVHKVFGTEIIEELLVPERAVVVSFGSTMVLESALKGVSCAVLSDVHFADAPNVTRIHNIKDWLSCITASRAVKNDVLDWYADFMERYCFKEAFRAEDSPQREFVEVLLENAQK